MLKVENNKNLFILPSSRTVSTNISIDTSYQKLGTGLGSSIYGYKTAFDSKGNFYVVGQFTSAGGVSVNNIAKWNGTSWSDVGGGTNGYLLSLYIDASDNIYVGGQISRCDPLGVNLVVRNLAKWDGLSWSNVGGGANGDVFTISQNTNGDILVGGQFSSVGTGGTLLSTTNFSSWNGTSWTNYLGGVGVPLTSNLVRAIAVLQNKIYVCGRFTSTPTIPANNVVFWDGSWNALGSGLNNDTSTITSDGLNKLYFAGGFTTANGNPVFNGLAVYDVNTKIWSGLPNNGFPACNDIEIDKLGNLYVTGIGNFIKKFDGTSWSDAATGFNNIVRDMSIISDGVDLYVTGDFTQISGEVFNYVAKILLARNINISTTILSILILPKKKRNI